MRRLGPESAELVNKWAGRYAPGSDFTPFLDCDLNVCLVEGEGGALFVWRGPGIYEVHVFFEQRGKAVLDLSHEMLRIMRSEHGARVFWAAVPTFDRRAIMFTRLMGWKPEGYGDFPQGRCQLFISERLPCLQQ